MEGVTHRTLGRVVLLPSQVRSRRSLAVVAVVVLSGVGVGVGAALLRTSNRAGARKDRSMFGLYDINKYYRRDCVCWSTLLYIHDIPLLHLSTGLGPREKTSGSMLNVCLALQTMGIQPYESQHRCDSRRMICLAS